MEIKLEDSWKKESKRWGGIAVFVGLIAIFVPIALYFWGGSDSSATDSINAAILLGLLFLIALYGFLYSFLYRIIVIENKIIRKTLFKSVEIEFSKIQSFQCKRYSRSELYLFSFNIDGRKEKIYTRYKEQMIKILQDNNVKYLN